MDNNQDVVASQEYQPLPEIAKVISNLEILRAGRKTPFDAQSSTAEVSASLSAAIEFLKKGEPFHPEPHPDSGQGKWKDMAAQMSRNADFYQDIVRQVGAILGKEAYTADDGSIQDSVLALKVPELVKALKDKVDPQSPSGECVPGASILI